MKTRNVAILIGAVATLELATIAAWRDAADAHKAAPIWLPPVTIGESLPPPIITVYQGCPIWVPGLHHAHKPTCAPPALPTVRDEAPPPMPAYAPPAPPPSVWDVPAPTTWPAHGEMPAIPLPEPQVELPAVTVTHNEHWWQPLPRPRCWKSETVGCRG
jgi:hypothetical protein